MSITPIRKNAAPQMMQQPKHSNRARVLMDHEREAIWEGLDLVVKERAESGRDDADLIQMLHDLIDQSDVILVPWEGAKDYLIDHDGMFHQSALAAMAEGQVTA